MYIITIPHIKFGMCSLDARCGDDLPTQKFILGENEILVSSSVANTNRKLDLSCPTCGKLVYHTINFRQGYLGYYDGHIKVQRVVVSASISIL